MRPLWSLRTIFLALILISVVAVMAFNYLLSRKFVEVDVRQRTASRLVALGSHLETMSAYLLARDDVDTLRVSVATLSALPELQLILIVDRAATIVASNRPELQGLPWSEGIKSYSSVSSGLPSLAEVFPGNGAERHRIVEPGGNGLMVGYFGLLEPGAGGGDATSLPVARVVAVLDTSRLADLVNLQIRQLMLASGLLVLIVSAGIWFAVHRLVQRPLKRLVDTSRELRSGNFSVSAQLPDENELGEISSALDALAIKALSGDKALSLNTQLMDIIEHSINEIYIVSASDFRILSANGIARKNRGYAILQGEILFPWQFLQTGDEAMVGNRLSRLRDGVSSHETLSVGLKRSDGLLYDVELTFQILDSSSPPIILVIAIDVEELHEQYRQLQLQDRAMDSVDTGLSIVDARKDGLTVVYVNRGWCRMTGYSREQAIGQSHSAFMTVESNEAPLKLLEDARTRAEPVEVQLTSKRKDGTDYQERLTMTPVRDDAGMVTHYIFASRDVTEEMLTRQHLEQTQRLESVGLLSGGIAHDFNNVLSVVEGYLEFLALKSENSEQLELIREADNAVRMGTRLTRRLLAFAKRSQVPLKLVNVNTQVLDSLELLRSAVGETVSLSTSLSADLWPVVCDQSQLENTIINLMINARDAMADSGRVSIQTENVSIDGQQVNYSDELLPGDYVRLRVEDNGRGMCAEVKTRALEPFFTTKEYGKGTGLGLPSIHAFMKQSGGCIVIHSTPGFGTTVELYFPRGRIDVSNVTDKRKPPVTSTLITGSRVLVVDDSDAVRKVTVKRLVALGYQADHADSCKQAMQKIETSAHSDNSFDIVLSDVVMEQDGSGYKLASWVRENHPACRIIFATAYSDARPDDVRDIPLLQKPYTLDEMKAALSGISTPGICVGLQGYAGPGVVAGE